MWHCVYTEHTVYVGKHTVLSPADEILACSAQSQSDNQSLSVNRQTNPPINVWINEPVDQLCAAVVNMCGEGGSGGEGGGERGMPWL